MGSFLGSLVRNFGDRLSKEAASTLFVESSAEFSPCGRYRRTLMRKWGTGNRMLNGLLCNPSKATAEVSDPTVTRFGVRALRMGFDGFYSTNIFDWRSADIRELQRVDAPNSPENDEAIVKIATLSEMIICGWGNASPLIPSRAAKVVRLLCDVHLTLHALRVSSVSGQPCHPLYLPYSLQPFEWWSL